MASKYVYRADVLFPAIYFFEYLNSVYWVDGYVVVFLRNVETWRCLQVRGDAVLIWCEGRLQRLPDGPLARAYMGLIAPCAILECAGRANGVYVRIATGPLSFSCLSTTRQS